MEALWELAAERSVQSRLAAALLAGAAVPSVFKRQARAAAQRGPPVLSRARAPVLSPTAAPGPRTTHTPRPQVLQQLLPAISTLGGDADEGVARAAFAAAAFTGNDVAGLIVEPVLGA